jgi:DNA-binding LacI/PurR family transcriptional regulator
VYYGCCEPLHNKIDIIKRIPHVRKVSMSPWADTEKGAQRLGKDLVFSDKPNPAFLAGPTWDPEVVRKDLQDTLDACKRYGTPVEFILKDISTVAYQPQRLWEWAEIAMRVAKQ